MHQIYTAAKSEYSGRVTVPVLWDKEKGTIVNNESSEIIRFFDSEFDDVGASGPRLLPTRTRVGHRCHQRVRLRQHQQRGLQVRIRHHPGSVRRGGQALFAALDQIDLRLSGSRYLVGEAITEADWRLFTTLLSFDPVYVGHFKCNIRRLVDYPNLWAYTRELYQVPGVAETVHMDHIKDHYYRSHGTLNPSGVVPAGPEIDFTEPHDRDNAGKSRR